MRDQRYRDTRTRSPTRPRNREREIEESRHPHRGSDLVRSEPERNRAIDSFERRDYERAICPVRSEPERGRAIGSVGKREYGRHYYDRDKDGQLGKLSQINESSSCGESPSMKFQWNHLLAEKPQNSSANPNLNLGLGHISRGYGNETSRIRTEKGYHRSGYSDLGVVQKSESTHIGSASSYSKYPLNDGNNKTYGHFDSGFKSPLRHFDSGFKSPLGNSNLGLYKNEDFRLRDYSHLDKLAARASYKEEEKPLYSLRDTSYLIPTSQTKAFATASSMLKNNFVGRSYKDGHPLSSDGFSRNSGMLTEPVSHDGYDQKSLMKSYTNSELLSTEIVNYRQSHRVNPTEDIVRDYKYAEVQRSERTDLGARPNDRLYDKIVGVREDYRHQDSLGASIVDSIVDRIDGTTSSYGDGQRESKLYDHHHSLPEKSIPSYLDVTRASHGMERVGEVVGAGSTHFKYVTKVYPDHQSLLFREDYGLETDGGKPSYYYENSLKRLPMSGHDQGLYEGGLEKLPLSEHDYQVLYEDSLKRLPMSEHDQGLYEDSLKSLQMSEHDVVLYEAEDSLQQRSTADDIGLHDISVKMLKRKRGLDEEETSVRNPNSKLSCNLNAYDDTYNLSNGDEQWPDEDIEQLYSSKASGFSRSHFAGAEMTDEEMACRGIAHSDDWLSSPNLQVSMQGHTSKPIKSARRDIKKRLGPAHIDVKNRLGTAGRDIKKRLGPAGSDIKRRLGPAIRDIKERLGPPRNVQRLNPFFRKYKQFRSLRRICDDFSGSSHAQVCDLSKVEEKTAKAEPPEDSEEFKQQVHSEFLKFAKLLNENSAQRRKYTENGGTGTLKCSICSMRGRNSKEYVDTLSLVKHSFKSRTVGSRAQHLGFYKALCVLMGWSCAVDPNDNTWVHQVLPDAEALAMKEDLFIWPPVVIVLNSSIANSNPDERVIVSIEGLEAILRDMGFDGGKTKVCRGKPANQSIMVVSFNGTFSGLQDAERLHKFYAVNKHGRAEFQKINFSRSSGESRKVPAHDKVESVLYGYLGIAGDLYKLDFETKKRSVVKSKKEILAIADATRKDE